MANKVCDNCGKEIPDSEHRSESDIGTYWCDDCEGSQSETIEDVEERLSDRAELADMEGLHADRERNPVSETHAGD